MRLASRSSTDGELGRTALDASILWLGFRLGYVGDRAGGYLFDECAQGGSVDSYKKVLLNLEALG